MRITVAEAVKGYVSHAQSLGLTPGYVETQMSYLTRFARTCDQAHREAGLRGQCEMGHLAPGHVSSFFLLLPNTRASQNRALSALRAFASYAERMEYLEPGKANWLLGDRKCKPFVRRPKYYIPVSQFRPMIEAAGSRHPVERATMALAFYTLGRQGELAGLKLKDLNLQNMAIRIYRPKRKRWTDVTITPELASELHIWLLCYAKQTGYINIHELVTCQPEWYLVPAAVPVKGRGPGGAYDAGLTTWEIDPARPALRLEKLVKRLLDTFGAETENGQKVRHLGEGMHTVRRSGARAMIDHLASVYGEDKALLMVSTMLDHESVEMTLLYIGRNIEQKRLNEWLKTNSMYGTSQANVIPMRRLSAASSQGEVDAL